MNPLSLTYSNQDHYQPKLTVLPLLQRTFHLETVHVRDLPKIEVSVHLSSECHAQLSIKPAHKFTHIYFGRVVSKMR